MIIRYIYIQISYICIYSEDVEIYICAESVHRKTMESEVLKPGQCRAPSPSAPSARPDSRDGWVLKRPIFLLIFPGIS